MPGQLKSKQSSLSRVVSAIATVQHVLFYARNDIQNVADREAIVPHKSVEEILAMIKKMESIFEAASREFLISVGYTGDQILGVDRGSSSFVDHALGTVRNRKKTDQLSAGRATCPFEEIIASYTEILPELPGVRVVDSDRKNAIAKRWEWVLTSKRTDGSRRAETPDQAMEWFRKYFQLARDNDFVMGRTQRSSAHQNWKCDIEFLMSSKGLKQVIEKTEVK